MFYITYSNIEECVCSTLQFNALVFMFVLVLLNEVTWKNKMLSKKKKFWLCWYDFTTTWQLIITQKARYIASNTDLWCQTSYEIKNNLYNTDDVEDHSKS